ncbi:MAG TPA: hypothetical protein PKN48_06105 [Bacteroidales bacterium]|nr:hypothetical protein [Bacteroidales bacterium]
MSFFKDKKFAILFVIACSLSTVPVFFNTFALSLDGPAHLYNSNLIAELLKGNPVVNDYVSFNKLHLTNWSGHLILTVFNLVAPAWIAQKVFILLLVVSFPLSFGFMVNRLNYSSRYLSFIIIPFSYSIFFFLGFYNFLLAVIFFFLWLAFIYKESRVYSAREKVLIFILCLLMECSHVFMFTVAMAIFMVYLALPVIRKNKFRLFITLRELLKPLKTFLVLSSGGLLLFLFYYFNKTGQFLEQQDVTVTWYKIFSDVFTISPLLCLTEKNSSLTSILFILIELTVVFLIAREFLTGKYKNSYFFLYTALLVLCFFVLTMAFFDQGLYIQSRFLFLFFIFLFIWIALQKVPKLIQIGLIIFSLVVFSLFINYYKFNLYLLSSRCYAIYDVGQKIDKNARVFCVNFSDHWLESHQLNYLGAENPLILYDNYECNQNYFPLKWKNQEIVETLWDDFYKGIYSKTFSENVDYVAILEEPVKNSDDQTIKSLSMVKNNYTPVLVSIDKRLTIYKKNPNE